MRFKGITRRFPARFEIGYNFIGKARQGHTRALQGILRALQGKGYNLQGYAKQGKEKPLDFPSRGFLFTTLY